LEANEGVDKVRKIVYTEGMKCYKLTYKNPYAPDGEAFAIKHGRTLKEAQGYAEKAIKRKIEVIKSEEL